MATVAAPPTPQMPTSDGAVAAGSNALATAPEAAPPLPTQFHWRTRHASYGQVTFDELPGWQQDDLLAGWPAFRRSCTVLSRRETWRQVCDRSAGVEPTPQAIRRFFEAWFVPIQVLDTDASREGDITGYFEPLLEGRRQPQGDFNVPVIGLPRDLYTLDWASVPAPLRRNVVHIKPQGNELVVVPPEEPGSVAMDLGRFDLDTKDRRLRVRVSREGGAIRAEPYPTRAELVALGMPAGVDAPVLAWVNDALALYAMQIQGSGRIRLGDSTVLRVNYADQNGHPFKPLRVASKANAKPVMRSMGSRMTPDDVDQFVLVDDDERAGAASQPDTGTDTPAVLTRGMSGKRPVAPGPGPSQDAAVNSMIEELLRSPPKRPLAPGTGPAAAVANRTAPAVQAAPPVAANATPRAFEPSRLNSDPSYVFFKAAADQTPTPGPPGALGVPLTTGRSVAVDPRVIPLGYPVFLSAPAPPGSSIDLRRLVFAQDTGGAIRGAVRADFFWGFGPDAGRLARGTRHRGQMWLLMPSAEVSRLGNAGAVTRSIEPAKPVSDECLVADGDFCQ